MTSPIDIVISGSITSWDTAALKKEFKKCKTIRSRVKKMKSQVYDRKSSLESVILKETKVSW